MRRINQQILRGVLVNTALVSFVVLLMLAVAKISQYLKQVAFGELPFAAVLSLVGLALPSLISTVLPIAVFFGVYLTFNRLYRQNEMMAIAGAGVSLRQLARPAMLAMLAFFILQLFISFYWAPESQRRIVREANEYARLAGLALIQPGAFNRLPGGRILYLGEPFPEQPDRYQGVFVYESDENGERLSITTATWGQVSITPAGGLELILLEGRRYMGVPGKPGFKVLAFERYRVHLPPPELNGVQNGPGRMPARSSTDLLGVANQTGPDQLGAWAELQWRIGWPLLLPLLTLLAIPLSYTPPRGGRAGGILIGVLLLLIFNNLLLLAKNWVEKGQAPLLPGIWWVHGLLLLVALYTFYRRNAGQEIWPFGFLRS
ncbi:LPS export ABC transporter permease LptF [Thermithiobacillus plumbiphilus]|uniref:LPS export ABC transporter permease LptF n=1 Tax=Thermithiobacillus plumbiphilus TaxID=1729899 RepID=A0ABU9D7X3_9PROT